MKTDRPNMQQIDTEHWMWVALIIVLTTFLLWNLQQGARIGRLEEDSASTSFSFDDSDEYIEIADQNEFTSYSSAWECLPPSLPRHSWEIESIETEICGPNEVVATKIYEGQLLWDDSLPEEVPADERLFIYNGEEFIKLKDLPSGPNEPECEHTVISSCLVYGCDCRTCANCGKRLSDWQESYMPPDVPDELFKIGIMKHIPIWPDYIELEKELCIDMPYSVRIGIGYGKTETWRFPKGTRIYFKEDGYGN